MFQVLAKFQCLYATDTYGDYAMQGSWSDGDTYGSAVYDGQGSGDDFYGVRVDIVLITSFLVTSSQLLTEIKTRGCLRSFQMFAT